MEKEPHGLPEWDRWDESLNGLAPDAEALARAVIEDKPEILEGTSWSLDKGGVLTLTLSGSAADKFCAALPDRVREIKSRRR